MTLSEARAETDATRGHCDTVGFRVALVAERDAADAEIAFLESQNLDAARSREELVRQLADAQRENARMREVCEAGKKRIEFIDSMESLTCCNRCDHGNLDHYDGHPKDRDLIDDALRAALTALAPKETK